MLDEPQSALDLRLRQHMRHELRAIQRRVGITFIYITHDQGEALTMSSDRVAVMNAGNVEQIGDGRTIYDKLETAFVASFVGENNGFNGKVVGSRLQRYDRGQEEAALDLGATPTQVFCHILIPYLMPAIITAAAIACLSSFENYNTTTFAILADKTLTTVLAGRVRQGTTPAISAIAVVIIAVTVVGAFLFGVVRQREQRREDARMRAAADADRVEMLA